mmetsp:Transcript_25496/g.46117  ORF Transcript_25496/g.46117 Transcript_25496/m.46117 type:complete len:84 (-) Transcript_25496:347-598(-)
MWRGSLSLAHAIKKGVEERNELWCSIWIWSVSRYTGCQETNHSGGGKGLCVTRESSFTVHTSLGISSLSLNNICASESHNNPS